MRTVQRHLWAASACLLCSLAGSRSAWAQTGLSYSFTYNLRPTTGPSFSPTNDHFGTGWQPGLNDLGITLSPNTPAHSDSRPLQYLLTLGTTSADAAGSGSGTLQIPFFVAHSPEAGMPGGPFFLPYTYTFTHVFGFNPTFGATGYTTTATVHILGGTSVQRFVTVPGQLVVTLPEDTLQGTLFTTSPTFPNTPVTFSKDENVSFNLEVVPEPGTLALALPSLPALLLFGGLKGYRRGACRRARGA